MALNDSVYPEVNGSCVDALSPDVEHALQQQFRITFSAQIPSLIRMLPGDINEEMMRYRELKGSKSAFEILFKRASPTSSFFVANMTLQIKSGATFCFNHYRFLTRVERGLMKKFEKISRSTFENKLEVLDGGNSCASAKVQVVDTLRGVPMWGSVGQHLHNE